MSPEQKERLKEVAKQLPVSIASYALGYGIARTAMESVLLKYPDKSETLRKIAPPILGAIASYAGYRAQQDMQQKLRGEKT